MTEQSQDIAPESSTSMAGFDVKNTHVFDPKTKRLVDKNPYRLFVIDGQSIYEWPVGSGNAWYGNRKFAGRLEPDSKGKTEFIKGAKHKEYVPPLTEDEELAREVATTKQENEKLKAELANIKREQAAASKPAPTSTKASRASGSTKES